MNLANMTKAVAVAMLILSGCATTQPAPPSVAARCPGTVAPPITPEMSMQAKRTADGLLREAIAKKQWTVQSRHALQQTLPHMTDCDRIAVLQSVVQATNRGDLKFDEGAFPPF